MAMDSLEEMIRRDYQAWSGGFPPETQDQIFLYLEYAASTDAPQEKVREILYEWVVQGARRP